MSEQAIIERREQLARTAMREALENQQAEDSVELLIQHHLEEIESTYWQKHFGTPLPTLLQVLEFLILDHGWEGVTKAMRCWILLCQKNNELCDLCQF